MFPVHPLAHRLLVHIRRQEFLHPGNRVGVAVSAGLDSIALLRLLLELRDELGIVLSVVHFNHKLRGAESDADEQFVADLAREHNLEFHRDSDDVAAQAAKEKISLEQAARDLRYGFFSVLLGSEDQSTGAAKETRLTKLATAHTLDDQAETVLLRLIRGTGLRGLRGIHPQISIEDDAGDTTGEIIRPLLGTRRRELHRYLLDLKQPWREDATNADSRFTRNRLRHLVLPLLEREFNPAVAENLAELAELARGEEDYWENESSGWLGTTVQWSSPDAGASNSSLIQIKEAQLQPNTPPPSAPQASLSRPWLLTEPIAVQRRVVKAIGDEAGIPLEFKHVEEILRFAAQDGPPGKSLSLPSGWKAIREPESLLFQPPGAAENSAPDYEYTLPLPGHVTVPEAAAIFHALQLAPEVDASAYNPQHLLDAKPIDAELIDAELAPGPLRVRNWRPGDRFWPSHTKSPRKIKELLAERHIAQPERKLWPVVVANIATNVGGNVVSGEDIIWMRGFPVPASFRARPGRAAFLIRELPLLHEEDLSLKN
jgi:tRNA(Ile)-lysidine synthase